jgi:ribosome biogenesis protein ERB1
MSTRIFVSMQALVKRLLTGCKWISYMDIHPTGDHVLLGSLDRRVAWFDMDLASTPYKTLRYHTKAIRCALFHKQVCN